MGQALAQGDAANPVVGIILVQIGQMGAQRIVKV
jgi:hypothetical protein